MDKKPPMIYGSVCSGIEAASVAWEPLGWKPSFLSEISAFPSAVLEHRFPTVPNFGDFTTITRGKVEKEGKFPAIDVLIGGTPCQSFSLAGLREGLGSGNGNLALEFVKLLGRIRPRWFVWENVPGVFSSGGGRDFAAILGGFTGKRIGVPADGWKNAGAISGIPDAYDVSWRVLDAQYFGVAQRRRRVFVVGCLAEVGRSLGSGELRDGEGFPNLAAAVLLERDCLCGNPPPGREKGKEPPADPASSPHGRDRKITTPVLCAVQLAHTGSNGSNVTIERSPTIDSGCSIAIAYGIDEECNVREDQFGTLLHGGDGGTRQAVMTNYTVRRITPVEAMRLQGFPDDWCMVPWNGKAGLAVPDGHQYHAAGNSMAGPVIRWIGERISLVQSLNISGNPQ